MAFVDDFIAVSERLGAFVGAMDSRDVEQFVACVSTDCVIDSPVRGRFQGHEGARRFCSLISSVQHQPRHLLTNEHVTVEGDAATYTCYLLDAFSMAMPPRSLKMRSGS
jgi:ketosteroid isomerase-like protein